RTTPGEAAAPAEETHDERGGATWAGKMPGLRGGRARRGLLLLAVRPLAPGRVARDAGRTAATRGHAVPGRMSGRPLPRSSQYVDRPTDHLFQVTPLTDVTRRHEYGTGL